MRPWHLEASFARTAPALLVGHRQLLDRQLVPASKHGTAAPAHARTVLSAAGQTAAPLASLPAATTLVVTATVMERNAAVPPGRSCAMAYAGNGSVAPTQSARKVSSAMMACVPVLQTHAALSGWNVAPRVMAAAERSSAATAPRSPTASAITAPAIVHRIRVMASAVMLTMAAAEHCLVIRAASPTARPVPKTAIAAAASASPAPVRLRLLEPVRPERIFAKVTPIRAATIAGVSQE